MSGVQQWTNQFRRSDLQRWTKDDLVEAVLRMNDEIGDLRAQLSRFLTGNQILCPPPPSTGFPDIIAGPVSKLGGH
jgi:hypothetical protein